MTVASRYRQLLYHTGPNSRAHGFSWSRCSGWGPWNRPHEMKQEPKESGRIVRLGGRTWTKIFSEKVNSKENIQTSRQTKKCMGITEQGTSRSQEITTKLMCTSHRINKKLSRDSKLSFWKYKLEDTITINFRKVMFWWWPPDWSDLKLIPRGCFGFSSVRPKLRAPRHVSYSTLVTSVFHVSLLLTRHKLRYFLFPFILY